MLTLLIPLALQAQPEDNSAKETPETGLRVNSERAFRGYTLYAPLIGGTAFLLDINGEVVNSWELDAPTSQDIYLLENGNLLIQSTAQGAMLDQFGQVGGVAGSIKEYTWDGDLVWSYDDAGDTHQQHHDIEPLPNGNILLIAWETISAEEALAAGMRPEQLPDGGTLWPDHVVEINLRTDEIVWKWRVWDHLVQDYDPDLPNYGIVSEHPERIEVTPEGEIVWDYVNGFYGNLPESGYFGPTSVFRAFRYPSDHPAFVEFELLGL